MGHGGALGQGYHLPVTFGHSELYALEGHPVLCGTPRPAGPLQVTSARQYCLIAQMVTEYHAGPVDGHKSQRPASPGLMGRLERKAGGLPGDGAPRLHWRSWDFFTRTLPRWPPF